MAFPRWVKSRSFQILLGQLLDIPYFENKKRRLRKYDRVDLLH